MTTSIFDLRPSFPNFLICLGEPEAKFFEFSDSPRSRNPFLDEPLHLGVAVLRLGQATVPVLFFLRLILESVTFLFGIPMKDI